MSLKDVLKSWLVRLSGLDLTAYICIVIAVIGGFVCGWNNIILWYMLIIIAFCIIRYTLYCYLYHYFVLFIYKGIAPYKTA